MKSKPFFVGILAMALVLGMTVIGCDNGTPGGDNTGNDDNNTGNGGASNSLAGTTWRAPSTKGAPDGYQTLTFGTDGTTWILVDDHTFNGTYSVSGNTITFHMAFWGTGTSTGTIIDDNTLEMDGDIFRKIS
jgi:hypothetical protein